MNQRYMLSLHIVIGIMWLTGLNYGTEYTILTCVCDSCSETNYTCTTDGACLTTLQRTFIASETVRTRQCAESPSDLILCDPDDLEDEDSQYLVNNCCYYDMCNQNADVAFPTIKSSTTANDKGEKKKLDTNKKALIIAGLLCLVVLIVGKVVHKYRKWKTPPPPPVAKREDDISSGGSGLPLLQQRTVARQISIIELVGRGRYGQVYKATWNGQDVAVKSFISRDDGSWSRETEIYQTVMLRHQNILGFIASDSKDTGINTQLWLITDYHNNGSLCDYLQRVQLDVNELLRLAYSAISGLAHLHMEIIGCQGKPAIAHRDIKSRNILVKDDGTCCIADLGLAVRQTSSPGFVDIPTGNRVGTIRYLAPEFLGDFYTVSCFDGYKIADMYSFGLVLWEMTRRCNVDGVCEEYQLPYYDKVPADPSVDDMHEVVGVGKYRPLCLDRWQTHTTLTKIWKLIKECWAQEPLSRVTALRVKKSLHKYIIESSNQDKAC